MHTKVECSLSTVILLCGLSFDFPINSLCSYPVFVQVLPQLRLKLQPSVTELMIYFIDYYSSLDLHEVVISAASSSVRRRLVLQFIPVYYFGTASVKREASIFEEGNSFI